MSTTGCTRQEFLKGMGVGAAALAMSGSACSTPSGNRPNIIVVMIDNIGIGDFGFSGNPNARTPHLDKFGAEGIQFSRFNAVPMCAPTRACLMTGRDYYRTGVIHTSRGGALMHGDEVTIPNYLNQAGYATGMFGKWHLGDNYPMRPMDQGFDEALWHKSGRIGQVPVTPNTYINPKLMRNDRQEQMSGYCTDIFFNEALQFIEKHRQEPFFVYLPTNVGHTAKESEIGKMVPEQYAKPFVDKGMSKTLAGVYGMVANFDENFGRLIDQLEALGLREDTIVLFTSDDGPGHGFDAGLRNGTVYEGRMRVPLHVQWPAHLEGGRTIDRIASHIDILPTLLDVNDMPIPDDPVVDGKSLLPLLKGHENEWPDRKLFMQCHRGLEPKPYQNCAVISQQYKMVGYPETFNDENLQTSTVDPIVELYDLEADPGEQNDLASTRPEVVSELRAAYDAWFENIRATRNFTPGIIHIGNPAEKPTHLCRYQDSQYVNGKPTGWLVDIEHSGDYQCTINRGSDTVPGKLCVRVNDTMLSKPLAGSENTAIFHLLAGEANIDVWVQEEGKTYTPRANEDTIGDVDVLRL
jgi:arylsulfatase A-like enzyme